MVKIFLSAGSGLLSFIRRTPEPDGSHYDAALHATGTALNYFAYNFIKIHRTLRMSPAMAAGVETRLWSVEDLVAFWEAYEQRRAERAASAVKRMDDSQPTVEQKRQQDIERTKLKMDLVKHVSTLSSGAIVILAAFLNKSPAATPKGGNWLIISVTSLIVSLVSALVYFWAFGLARQWQRLGTPRTFSRRIEKVTGLLVALGFCSGIVFLGAFVIKNSK